MPTIGQRLKLLRESIKLSQAKLGVIAELKQAAVNRYEHNQAEAPYRVLLWYADYFDVSMDYIFGRCDEPQGKMYNYEPKFIKDKIANNEELQQFIEMCFDPNSSMSGKLKNTLLEMMKGGDEIK